MRIRSLTKSFLSSIQKRYPEILNARYDFDAGQFLDSQGMPLRFDRAKKPAIEAGDENSAEMGIEARKSGARAGEATLRRGIFLQSLVSGEGRERPELLEQLQLWNREYVTSGTSPEKPSARRRVWREHPLRKHLQWSPYLFSASSG